MRETAGIAAVPATRCRNRRRGSFVAFTLSGWPCSMAASTGRRCARPLFETISAVLTLLLRRSLMLMGPPQCGKSTLLKLLFLTVAHPFKTDDPSPAALYHKRDANPHATFLVDEGDNLPKTYVCSVHNA